MAVDTPNRTGSRRRIISVVLGLICAVGIAAANDRPTPVQRAESERTEAMMVAAQGATRAIAFTLGQSWANTGGEAGAARYRDVLWSAWQRAERSFSSAVRDGGSKVGLFRASFANWRTLGREAVVAVNGPLEDSGTRLAALDQRFEQATRSRMEVDERLAASLDAVVSINTAGSTLSEIEGELAALEKAAGSCKPRQPTTLRRRLEATLDGRAVLAAEGDLLAARRLRDAHFEATRYNREQNWAPSSTREFAKLLNARRQALGLEPMRLERRLWQACANHAEEMKRLGYFAHESPLVERRTPDKRAEIAKFDGSFEGENLFQSRSPQAPENVLRSWWASDLHRYVLFAGRPNRMGLDPGGGTHWTLMTGRL